MNPTPSNEENSRYNYVLHLAAFIYPSHRGLQRSPVPRMLDKLWQSHSDCWLQNTTFPEKKSQVLDIENLAPKATKEKEEYEEAA